jgi:hypothetical protein
MVHSDSGSHMPSLSEIPKHTGLELVDVMLEKQIGCPCIHCLHVLTLLESDFNQAVRIIIGRQLGFRLEDDNTNPSMQCFYGK